MAEVLCKGITLGPVAKVLREGVAPIGPRGVAVLGLSSSREWTCIYLSASSSLCEAEPHPAPKVWPQSAEQRLGFVFVHLARAKHSTMECMNKGDDVTESR